MKARPHSVIGFAAALDAEREVAARIAPELVQALREFHAAVGSPGWLDERAAEVGPVVAMWDSLAAIAAAAEER